MNRVRSRALVVVAAVFMLAGALVNDARADAAMWTGRAQKHGYFDNKEAGSEGGFCARGPVLYNDCYKRDAIPGSVNTGQEVYDFLRGAYNDNKQNKTGVAFIVNTMLGRDPKDGVRTISAGMWDDLHDRLTSSALSITKKSNVGPGDYGDHDTYYQYTHNDVAWYDNGDGDDGNGLIFKQGTKTVYVLLYACGNPVGNFDGLPKPPQWNISTSTSVTTTRSTTTPPLAGNEVIPGNTIKWTGTVKNNGPDATDTDVATHLDKSNDWNGNVNNRTIGDGFKNNATSQSTYTYQPTTADLGKTLCLSTWAQPRAWNNDAAIDSAESCINVVYRYGLTPHATFGGQLEKPAELGSTAPFTVNTSVDNGGPTASKPTNWQLFRCTYGPTVPAGTYASTAPNSGGASPGGPCQSIANSPGTQVFGNGTSNLPDKGGETIPANTTAGTHICYVLSINPASAADGSWKHSAPACLSVTKSPKVQAWGADVSAGTVSTRPNYAIDGKYYGSWAEYGIFGAGAIAGMGSNASLAGGAATSPTPTVLNALTFANAPSLGYYYSAAPTPNADYDAYYALRTATTGSTSAGGAVGNGTQSVVAVNGDLTINNNITYSGSYANPGQIPRVVYVVSGNIRVNANVTQIDAWLIAKGTLYTCSDDSAPTRKNLTLSDCNQRLTFNGPVSVSNSRLSRTSGADTGNKGDPAEVFNLAPSNFLSSYTTSVSQSNIQTVYEKELPPRW